MHEVKIHNVVYDDFGAKTAKKWHWCSFKSLDWRLEKVVGWRGLSCLMVIEMRYSSCIQWYFVPLMNFQHMGIWVDIVLRAIMHALSVKKTQATYNWNMEEKQCTLGIDIFSNLITLIGNWKKLLMKVRKMKLCRYP